MATFKELKPNSIYYVKYKYSSGWSGYSTGYYMTLGTLEAEETPTRWKQTIFQVDSAGDYLLDEDGDKIPRLDEDGNKVQEFYYDKYAKKASIWMIYIPRVEIKSSDNGLNREVDERPKLDPNDLHLVQTKHIGSAAFTNCETEGKSESEKMELLYSSFSDKYVEEIAERKIIEEEIQANAIRAHKVCEEAWNLFVSDDGKPYFSWEDGEPKNREYYLSGEGPYYGALYLPSMQTLFKADDLIKSFRAMEKGE